MGLTLNATFLLQRLGTNICFVGRVETQKGLGYLLKAFSIIVQEGCNAKLFIVGDGRQKTLLEDLSRHLAIDDQVVFTGFAEDVLHLLSAGPRLCLTLSL